MFQSKPRDIQRNGGTVEIPRVMQRLRQIMLVVARSAHFARSIGCTDIVETVLT